jgi:hypothetical protein
MGVPLERPDQFAGKSADEITAAELAVVQEQRDLEALERAPTFGGETGAGPIHWYEHYGAKNSRPWMIVEPRDGRIPPMTSEGQARAAALRRSWTQRSDSDAAADRSLWDRCITRGVPGSMMPGIYGSSYQIVQSPGNLAIRYEMIHETRIVPVDGRPHAGIRSYMGDARGRWEGTTLVVETVNLNGRQAADRTGFPTPGHGTSDSLRIVERFSPVAPNTLAWSVMLEDPHTWTRPWTFAMNLTKDPGQTVFEYACHEGNYGLTNILSAARSEEKSR